MVSQTFAKVLNKAVLSHIRFHNIRNTRAILLLKVGIHSKIVSERLGHANLGITLDTYSHVLPGLQKRAAGARSNCKKMLAEAPIPDSVGR